MEKMTEQELVGLKYLEMLRLMVVVKNLDQIIKDRASCYSEAKEIMTSHRWDEVVSPDLAYNICDAGLMLADVLKDGGTDDGIRADFSDPR